MLLKPKKHWKKSLAFKLLLATWVVSSVGTFIFTAIQVMIDYSQAQEKLLKTFDVVEKSYIAPLAESMWNIDRNLIEAQVLGLSKLDGVVYIGVSDSSGNLISQNGNKNVEGATFKIFRLEQFNAAEKSKNFLGTIETHLDLLELRQTFVKKALIIFAIQGTKAFLVSTILFLVFNQLVVSPIVKKTNNLRRSRNLGFELPSQESKDELESLIFTVDELIHENEKAVIDLKFANETLEMRIAERTADLEAFSYSVAHDLRSPLRSINGFATIVSEDYSQNLPKEAQDYLKRIMGASIKMGNLIDDVLKISKISREAVSRSTVALTEMANEIVEQKRQTYADKNHSVFLQPGMSEMADPRMVYIILDNLLDNAFKYSSKSDNPKVSFLKDETRNCYVVEDNGVGFDMKYVEKIFGIFQRLHSQDEFPGTGVGLSSVERIIRKHNGKVWAESVLGQGTKIYFTLNG